MESNVVPVKVCLFMKLSMQDESAVNMEALEAAINLAVDRTNMFIQDKEAADSLVRTARPKAATGKKKAKAKAKGSAKK